MATKIAFLKRRKSSRLAEKSKPVTTFSRQEPLEVSDTPLPDPLSLELPSISSPQPLDVQYGTNESSPSSSSEDA
ncbi:Uncharacterized protein TCM_023196 [Theobroma cacao]|uniref:Uncharacterized protein n=1 Tax=Theobroma cacao TaxID=3641 RepID=A0A061EU28_THECC|nr:Uncharacterized protein TCM_023196 [Theobroma cacao]